MKNKFGILLLVCSISTATFSGCTTSSTGVTTISPIAVSSLTVAAQLGTQIAVSKDPTLKPYLTLGAQAILALAQSGTTNAASYDPAAVTAALSTAGKVNSTDAILLADALTLYNGAFQQIVAQKLDPNLTAKPLLIGIATGIQQGLTAGPITAVIK